MTRFFPRLLVSLAGAVLLGGVIASLGPGSLWAGWLAASFLCWISLFVLASVWRWAEGGKTLGWMVALAFLLRLGIGVYLTLVLPVAGYDEPQQNQGYLFNDAFRRDSEAWGYNLSATSPLEILSVKHDTDPVPPPP